MSRRLHPIGQELLSSDYVKFSIYLIKQIIKYNLKMQILR
jgi:hypothetical protein